MGVSVMASCAFTTSRSIDDRSPAAYFETPRLSRVLYPRSVSALARLVVPVFERPMPKILPVPTVPGTSPDSLAGIVPGSAAVVKGEGHAAERVSLEAHLRCRHRELHPLPCRRQRPHGAAAH